MSGSGEDHHGPDQAGPNQSGPDQGGEAEVGSLGLEAARLFGALSDWAREQRADIGQGADSIASQLSATLSDLDEHLATGSAECTVCPVCRTVHVMRGLSPEVKAHLASAASSAAQAAAALLATQVPSPGSPARATEVEHIEVADGSPADEPADGADQGDPS